MNLDVFKYKKPHIPQNLFSKNVGISSIKREENIK